MSIMPLFMKDPLTLIWMLSLWLCVKVVYSDVLPYGERIRPPKGVVNKVKQKHTQLLNVPQCETCHNNTAQQRKYTQTSKIAKRIDSSISPMDVHNINPLEKTQQTSNPIYSGFPKENSNDRGATFFFTQVEPHRYEYRAMFQHNRENMHHREVFSPFVHNFEPFSQDFPPLPKFPTFPDFPQIFSGDKDSLPNFPDTKDLFSEFPKHKDSLPNYPNPKDFFSEFPKHKDSLPNFPDPKDFFTKFPDHKDFPEFTFPTLPPVIKRVWEPQTEVQTQQPILEKDFKVPIVKKYDVVLGHTHYPKIFRFNEERINIEDFDREKKLRLYKLSKNGQNEIEPENVKRNQLLILHGGIFTVKEPPLFNKQVKKIRKSRIFGAKIS